MLVMCAILLVGIVALGLFFCDQARRTGRELSVIRENAHTEYRGRVDEAAQLDRELVGWLVEDRPTREAVELWQSRRSEIVPGQGWAWNDQHLKARRNEQYARELRRVRQRAVYTVILGALIILAVFGGLTLAAYGWYSSQRPTISALGRAVSATTGRAGDRSRACDEAVDLCPRERKAVV